MLNLKQRIKITKLIKNFSTIPREEEIYNKVLTHLDTAIVYPSDTIPLDDERKNMVLEILSNETIQQQLLNELEILKNG